MPFSLYDEAPNYLRSLVRDTRMHTPEKIAAPVHFSSHTETFAPELLNSQDFSILKARQPSGGTAARCEIQNPS
jgi:hypothetical protein